jgi:phospholipid-binding lipoprotein MlaA
MALRRSALDRLTTVTCFGLLAFVSTACSTFSGAAVPVDSAIVVGPPTTIEAALPPDGEIGAGPTATTPDASLTLVAAAPTASDAAVEDGKPAPEIAALAEGMAQPRQPGADTDMEPEEYDPWEKWNEPMFNFNRRVDQYVLKPVAKGYNFVVPDEIQIMISNGFDNISFVPRLVNSLLQGKMLGAGRELGRFLINSTAGVGGLFDPAKDVFGILKSREDFGQTLGLWGVSPGPYVIVPFLEPLTVRDGVGKAVDAAMDPLAYFVPLIWDRLAMKVGDIVNERSLNLDLFQGFEESVIDMYSAVRHAYLQRRLRLIRE